MADLEAVLADVSYLMAMEKSKCTPAARASKKIVLPDPRYIDPLPPLFAVISRGSIRSTTARPSVRPSVREPLPVSCPSLHPLLIFVPCYLPPPQSSCRLRRRFIAAKCHRAATAAADERPAIPRIGSLSLEVTGENCLQTAAGVALLARFELSRRRLKRPMYRPRPPPCSRARFDREQKSCFWFHVTFVQIPRLG